MGLIKSSLSKIENILNDQVVEYMFCERMEDDVLIKKGTLNSNIKNNIVKKDSKIIVGENQALIIISNDNIIDFTNETGYYTFDCDINQEGIVYFINTRQVKGSEFSTNQPISYIDKKRNINVNIKCYGEYMLQVTDPLVFFQTYGNDIGKEFIIDDKFKEIFTSSFLKILEVALLQVSEQNIPYDMLTSSIDEISKSVKEILISTFGSKGINISKVSFSSVVPTDESAKLVKEVSIHPIILEESSSELENKLYEVVPQNVESTDLQTLEQVECPNCGSIIINNFCTECGTKRPEKVIEKICSNCGFKAEYYELFCINCGNKL